MAYRFVREREDYSALASGQVLHSAPGMTAFPVRLASEIFQRCVARLEDQGVTAPYVLYDPCCGGGQLLATLAFLHGEKLGAVVGSDFDPDAVRLAGRNLGLLTIAGLEERIAQLEELRERYGKESHTAAITAAERLRERLVAMTRGRILEKRVFQADATQASELQAGVEAGTVALVITDVPYGRHSSWTHEQADATTPVWRVLEAVRPLMIPNGILAIAADRHQPVHHEHYRRIERLRLGRRQVTFLTP